MVTQKTLRTYRNTGFNSIRTMKYSWKALAVTLPQVYEPVTQPLLSPQSHTFWPIGFFRSTAVQRFFEHRFLCSLDAEALNSAAWRSRALSMTSQSFHLNQSFPGFGADPRRQMPWSGRIGWPRHSLLLQWLSVDRAYTRTVGPFLYDAVWCLYNLRHCANSNIFFSPHRHVLSSVRLHT
jgi:hypothetical protein